MVAGTTNGCSDICRSRLLNLHCDIQILRACGRQDFGEPRAGLSKTKAPGQAVNLCEALKIAPQADRILMILINLAEFVEAPSPYERHLSSTDITIILNFSYSLRAVQIDC